MTIIYNIGSKTVGQQPDTIDGLKETLKNYTLNPMFEQYGDFVNRTPTWDDPELDEKFKGHTTIFGNFLTHSYAFRITTDDEQLISEIEALVAENKKRPEYQAAKAAQGLYILLKSEGRDGNLCNHLQRLR